MTEQAARGALYQMPTLIRAGASLPPTFLPALPPVLKPSLGILLEPQPTDELLVAFIPQELGLCGAGRKEVCKGTGINGTASCSLGAYQLSRGFR